MIRQLIIKILFRKDVQTMAIIYATLIIKGKKTFADVPDRIKDCKCQYKNDQKVENKNVHFPRSIPQLVFP